MYPRKLGALLDVHVQINGGDKKEDSKNDKSELKKGYIDQVLAF